MLSTHAQLSSKSALLCPLLLPHLAHGADLVARAVRAAWIGHGVAVVPAAQRHAAQQQAAR